MPSLNPQKGVTLIESLVATTVLAIGILCLLTVQIRTLAETQTSVHRAQAVRAIEDLAERVKANPDGFGQLRAGAYASPWDATPNVASDACDSNACSPAELARSDVAQWRKTIARTLPLGQANVFTDESVVAADRRQLGVMVGWRANERTANGASPFDLKVDAAGVTCPKGLICHLVYVQP
ncbi:MAG: type pilus modification protein PilV [Variovorax sp.]|nr:type pilus modification protein PilV [Variovorax sp.]